MSNFISHHVKTYSEEEMKNRSVAFYELMNQRRTVREFSSRKVPKELIQNIIKTASTAPSGAHKQPWTFVAVSNQEIKTKIREAAEIEEHENYHGRMSEDWLKELEIFETNENKSFLEIAPWLIVVFRKNYDLINGDKHKNYYVSESVGLATGILLAAIHNAGLVSLTHTPSPMNFLIQVLGRPQNERPFLLIPIGYPPEDLKVPNLTRKPLKEISVFLE